MEISHYSAIIIYDILHLSATRKEFFLDRADIALRNINSNFFEPNLLMKLSTKKKREWIL